MKTLLLRAAALLLSILTLALPLTSCSLEDEDAFLATARELIARSATLNEIYFGAGIEYDPDRAGIGYYYHASEEYLEKAGFKNIKELKEMTAEVFTEEYCNIIYQSAFEGIKDENSIVYARYSNDETLSDTEGERTGGILVNSQYTPYDGMLAYERSYDLDSLEIVKVKRLTVTVKLNVTYTLREGYKDDAKLAGEREREVTFLRLDDGGFRINTPTY